jgi:hypothetical protein
MFDPWARREEVPGVHQIETIPGHPKRCSSRPLLHFQTGVVRRQLLLQGRLRLSKIPLLAGLSGWVAKTPQVGPLPSSGSRHFRSPKASPVALDAQ